MPPLPVIPNVFRCAFNWVNTGQIAVNVIHILDNTAAATASDIMNALDTTVTANMWGPVVPSASINDVGITPLDGIHATAHYGPLTPAHWTGQNGTDWVPQVAVVMKEGTGLRGRSHRGRIYLPFVAEVQIANGMLDATSAGLMSTHWESWRTALNSATPSCTLVVASYKLHTAAAVESILCEQPLATQRRRQGRLRGA